MEDLFQLFFLLLFIAFLITILYLVIDTLENTYYYYLDSNGIEHKVDFCDSSYGSFYCMDYETGNKFLVNSFRREYSKEKE